MVYAHVINKKTGLERKNVSVKAYELARRKYDLKGYVDENGDPVNGPNAVAPAAVKVQKKSVEPAAIRTQLTPEEIQAKKDEMEALNQKAIDAAVEKSEKAEKTEVSRKKPGPKPKNNA